MREEYVLQFCSDDDFRLQIKMDFGDALTNDLRSQLLLACGHAGYGYTRRHRRRPATRVRVQVQLRSMSGNEVVQELRFNRRVTLQGAQESIFRLFGYNYPGVTVAVLTINNVTYKSLMDTPFRDCRNGDPALVWFEFAHRVCPGFSARTPQDVLAPFLIPERRSLNT